MAVPGAYLCVVDSLASGVTIRRLLSFPGFMRSLRVLVLLPLWLLLTAEASPSPSTETSTPSPSASPQPSASPSPLPTPVNAFLSLEVTAGPPNTVINVSGGQFLPNQQMNLYWDTAAHVAGAATADANGSFNTRVKPYPGDKPGVHKLCASVQPNPCANFAVQAATPTPSPTPEESPSPLPSPSPTSNPTLIATPARTNSTLSGFDVISRPPFVFLPIFGIGALLLALAYWAFSVLRRPRHLAPIPTAAVVHRATRPDYSAAFGTPPPGPAAAPLQSAWEEPPARVSATPPPAAPRSPVSPPPTPPAGLSPAVAQVFPTPPVAPAPPAGPTDETPQHHGAWGLGEPDSGYPNLSTPETQRREPLPEPPQPGD